MKKILIVLWMFSAMVLVACPSSDPGLPTIQAIPDNKAKMNPSNVEPIQLVKGLSSKTLLLGEGSVAEAGSIAIVHYTGWLYDSEAKYNRGAQFDSSVDRGDEFRFRVGAGRVIRGWDQGVAGMRVGEVRELTVASEMAYGERGAGDVIPPGATLIFVVELLGIEGATVGPEAN